MKKLYSSILFVILLSAAPRLWAQLPELPEGACITPEIEQCVSVSNKTLQKWSEGTEQWPDEACNPLNSFGGCDTNSCDQANSWAQYVCESNGYDVGIWTGRTQAGCGPGGPGGPVTNGTGQFSIYCQDNSIPCSPIFEDDCVPSDQTQVEVFCCTFSRDPVAPIPTVSEIGLIVLSASLGIAGYMAYRRKKQ
ncbi:MAG TPA: IPTL-CTERM sorting domain-containing protein, partial [Thermodesulfobacteriota bacterium]|nr:IPTL-CTERM sorting domain-containing protein [Thermodesulfobacteriota bacterium]